MSQTFSIAYLTYAPLLPPDAISLAARCGYSAIGLRAHPVAPGADYAPLVDDPALRRETKARAASEGIQIFDMEIVRITKQFELAPLRPLIDLCGELGVKAVLVSGDDPDVSRLVENYASLCHALAPFGISADLEFMPWATVCDANTALRIVEAAGMSNGGILLDSLHAARSATTSDDLKAIPASMLHYAQISDALAEIPRTVEGLLHTARHERLLPGFGQIDLRAQFDALQARVPISVEVPNDAEKARRGTESWAKAALIAARKVLDGW